MKNFIYSLLIILLFASHADAAYNQKPDVSNVIGTLPVTNGGTGATGLADSLTNAGGELGTTQCVGRTVTGTSDTILATDGGCPVNYNSSLAVAVSLPVATTTGYTAGFGFIVNNRNTGAVTITPTTSTINGAASFVVPSNTGCYVYSNGTNYLIDLGSCSALPLALDTLPDNMTHRSVGVTIDGGGAVITTGVKGYYRVPFDATITGYSIQSDISGSAVVDVWKVANDVPTVADSITAAAKPTLSSDNYVYSTTLTSWNTTVSAGDVIAYKVDSASTVTRMTLQLFLTVRE